MILETDFLNFDDDFLTEATREQRKAKRKAANLKNKEGRRKNNANKLKVIEYITSVIEATEAYKNQIQKFQSVKNMTEERLLSLMRATTIKLLNDENIVQSIMDENTINAYFKE